MIERPRLVQEDYIDTEHGPWKVLVICQCLNCAAWPMVEVVVKNLFMKYPSPESCDDISLDCDEPNELLADLMNTLRCLGFGSKRANYMINMSRQYVTGQRVFGDRYDRYRIAEFAGCGRYALDAWDLFVLKRPCDPKDIHLRRYAIRAGLLKGE